ncbi:MAG: hypothetical protein ACT4ON_13580 [Bacteroidota bacterium]
MSKSKNNFRNPETKEKSKYKLWVCHNREGIKKGLPPKFTYYGYNTKADGGLASLKGLVLKRMQYIDIAQLYDNQMNAKIQEWDNRIR